MKKLICIVAIAVCGIFSSHAQNFRAEASAALPIGDAGDFYSFGLNVDLTYLIEFDESFLVGPTVGFKHYFGEEDFIDDASFIPIGGSARYGVDEFWFGVDLGYGIGVDEGNDGGFWYEPFAMYDFGNIGVKLSYSGISNDGFTFSALNLGVEFGW